MNKISVTNTNKLLLISINKSMSYEISYKRFE